jgi:hypothetical protein
MKRRPLYIYASGLVRPAFQSHILRWISPKHFALWAFKNDPSAALSRDGGQKSNLGGFKRVLNGLWGGVCTLVSAFRVPGSGLALEVVA